MDRRTFLASAGAAGALGLAGCAGDDEPPEGVVLPRVELGNATSEPVRFHVLVEYDGELEHWDDYEVDPGFQAQGMGSDLIDPELPEDPGAVKAHARVGNQRSRIDFEREGYGEGECVIATFLYGFRAEDRLSAHPTSVDDDWDADVGCPIDE